MSSSSASSDGSPVTASASVFCSLITPFEIISLKITDFCSLNFARFGAGSFRLDGAVVVVDVAVSPFIDGSLFVVFTTVLDVVIS